MAPEKLKKVFFGWNFDTLLFCFGSRSQTFLTVFSRLCLFIHFKIAVDISFASLAFHTVSFRSNYARQTEASDRRRKKNLGSILSVWQLLELERAKTKAGEGHRDGLSYLLCLARLCWLALGPVHSHSASRVH